MRAKIILTFLEGASVGLLLGYLIWAAPGAGAQDSVNQVNIEYARGPCSKSPIPKPF